MPKHELCLVETWFLELQNEVEVFVSGRFGIVSSSFDLAGCRYPGTRVMSRYAYSPFRLGRRG